MNEYNNIKKEKIANNILQLDSSYRALKYCRSKTFKITNRTITSVIFIGPTL